MTAKQIESTEEAVAALNRINIAVSMMENGIMFKGRLPKFFMADVKKAAQQMQADLAMLNAFVAGIETVIVDDDAQAIADMQRDPLFDCIRSFGFTTKGQTDDIVNVLRNRPWRANFEKYKVGELAVMIRQQRYVTHGQAYKIADAIIESAMNGVIK